MTRAEWDALVRDDPRAAEAVVAEALGWEWWMFAPSAPRFSEGLRWLRRPNAEAEDVFVLATDDAPNVATDYARHVPGYLTSWDAMREVVEKMRELHDGHFTLMAFTTNWRAGRGTPAGRKDIHNFVEADTAPLAVCTAALMALGVIE